MLVTITGAFALNLQWNLETISLITECSRHVLDDPVVLMAVVRLRSVLTEIRVRHQETLTINMCRNARAALAMLRRPMWLCAVLAEFVIMS